jgi:hypothetical protein
MLIINYWTINEILAIRYEGLTIRQYISMAIRSSEFLFGFLYSLLLLVSLNLLGLVQNLQVRLG